MYEAEAADLVHVDCDGALGLEMGQGRPRAGRCASSTSAAVNPGHNIVMKNYITTAKDTEDTKACQPLAVGGVVSRILPVILSALPAALQIAKYVQAGSVPEVVPKDIPEMQEDQQAGWTGYVPSQEFLTALLHVIPILAASAKAFRKGG